MFYLCSLVDVQNRISQGLKVLQYYTTKKWVFVNDNLLRMQQTMCKEDVKKFNFNIDEVSTTFYVVLCMYVLIYFITFSSVKIDQDKYITNYILGARHFLLKEKPETLPAARSLLRRLYLLDRLVSLICWGLALWAFWSNLDSIVFGCETMFETTRNLLSRRSSAMIHQSI